MSRRCKNIAPGYAAICKFDKAVEWQEKAITLTPSDERVDRESHLKLHRERKP